MDIVGKTAGAQPGGGDLPDWAGAQPGDGELPDSGRLNVVPLQHGSVRPAGVASGRAASTWDRELVSDLATIRLPRGARLLVAGDLHLGAAATAASRWSTGELGRRIESWQGPGAIVLAGDVFELLDPDMDSGVEAALQTHAEFADTLRRFSSEPGRTVVCLVGNHDGRLAWDDESAVAVREAFGCRLAMAVRADLTTQDGVRSVLLEHGHQLDPANAFVDPRSPNDTPLGHHVVRELLPPLRSQAGPWLKGAEGLTDPLDFPDFVASRLVYRRMLHRPWWMAAVFAIVLLMRLPLTYRLLTDLGHPRTTAELIRGVLLVALLFVGDLFLLGAIVLVGARRIWTTTGQRLVGARGPAQNEAPRSRAHELVAQGYAGLVTSHTHQPELCAVGNGFYANAGSGTQVVVPSPARLALPPVYLPSLQLSWIEIATTGRLSVRLFRGGRSLQVGTWLERRMARASAAGPPHPCVAVELEEPFRSPPPEGQTMRALIVPAPVGERRDAAARGLGPTS
jgi:UDP-2,3-diacylglucosamine pyrophosphatase LpxH